MAKSANRQRLDDGFASLMRIADPHSIEIRGDALSALCNAIPENSDDEAFNIQEP